MCYASYSMYACTCIWERCMFIRSNGHRTARRFITLYMFFIIILKFDIKFCLSNKISLAMLLFSYNTHLHQHAFLSNPKSNFTLINYSLIFMINLFNVTKIRWKELLNKSSHTIKVWLMLEYLFLYSNTYLTI